MKKIFLFTLIVFYVSCQVENETNIFCEEVKGGSCEPFEQAENASIIFDFYTSHEQFEKPTLNPNNPNELVYYHRFDEKGIRELVKYNILTKQKTTLTNIQGVLTRPRWGALGWIVYDDLDAHIKIMKSDGTQMSQVSSNGSNMRTLWNENGIVLYWQYSSNPPTNNFIYSYNIQTNKLDTLSLLLLPKSSDIKNNRLLYSTNINDVTHIGYFNLNNTIEIDNFTPIGIFQKTVTSMCWGNQGNEVYATCYNDGIYKIDVATGVSSRIMEFCDSKRYDNISCSSDGKYLVGERIDSYKDFKKMHIVSTSSVYFIELATMKEMKVCLN